MRESVAIEELKRLKDENVVIGNVVSWHARIQSTFYKALGKDHHLSVQFGYVRFEPRATVYSPDVEPESNEPYCRAGVDAAKGLIEAAIRELELSGVGDQLTSGMSYDPDLWEHVRVHIEDEDWYKLASQTAIFVEDRLRRWGLAPKDSSGNNLVGRGLWAALLADAGLLPLGQQASEREGWRFLGMGFAQALSNVDRHHIQRRADARQYAIGVLGLGSLLLTQIKHEHGPNLPPI